MSYESPPPATPDAADPDSAVPASAGPEAAVVIDELAILDQLEADLAAVEQAITTIDRITADGVGGDRAGAEIAAAVGLDRFGTGVPGAPGAADTI